MKTKNTRILTLVLVLLLLVSGCSARSDSKAATPQSTSSPQPQDTEGFTIATVETDEFTMDFLRFGHGKNTLVILPGLGVQSVMDSAEAVTEAYAPLTDAFTIYLFERRNELPASYSVYEMAQDTAAAMETLGLKNVFLFGVSMGGMIALDLAIEHPALVQKLAVGSTSACVTAEQFEPIAHWIELAKSGNAEELYLAFGAAVYPPDVFAQSQDLLVSAAAAVTGEELERFVIQAEGIAGFDVADALKRISCPVLVIGSQDDGVLGADASLRIAERLSGRSDCDIFMYDGYGHAAYDLAPDYKDRLLAFFVPEA